MSFLEQYFIYTDDYIAKYGPQTVVLMQCGAFFEVYGKKDDEGNISGSLIVEYSAITDLKRVYKCPGYIMSGFRDYEIDRYIKKLQDHGYTSVVFEEYDVAKDGTKLRRLQGIYSPGTYIHEDELLISNNIMCIWVEEKKTKLINKKIIGITNIDIITGESSLFEIVIDNEHSPTAYDEIDRLQSIYSPSEVILITNMEEEISREIINFSNLSPKTFHILNYHSENIEPSKKDIIKKSYLQKYQSQIFSKYFSRDISDSLFYDYGQYVYALASLCYLLQFIWEHSPFLVEKLRIPTFENVNNNVVLANHSLKQLNILSMGEMKGKLCCILNVLDNNITAIGKRKFRKKLLYPSFNSEYLLKEYQNKEFILEHREKVIKWRKNLYLLKDLEKMYRFIISEKIHPYCINQIYNNIEQVKEIFNQIKKELGYFFNYINCPEGIIICNELKDVISEIFILEACSNMNNIDYSLRFIHRERSDILDRIDDRLKENQNRIDKFIKSINSIIKSQEKKSKTTDYVKIHETEKGIMALHITQKRSTLLKTALQQKTPENYNNQNISNIKQEYGEITFATAVSSNVSICSEELQKLCTNITILKKKFQEQQEIVYKEQLSILKEKQLHFEKIIHIIGCVDNAQNNAYLASKFKLCKPMIDLNKDKSFVEAKGLYHPLIQSLQQDELYVDNDVSLGLEPRGILLYGTNAVGKTSLIKSLGISIIMAQAGLFVPCSSFIFHPYQKIMTRILGNDNIFKGLSTFAVEMIELKTILQTADQNSLILGDELCSGTEIDSAKSLFVSGLKWLYNRQSSFIFATHLHEIATYTEIEEMNHIHLKHLSVIYDKKINKLVYDRKLKDGPGKSMYGLEVCKSLHLPQEFLEEAIKLRNKYNYDRGLNTLHSSHYNSEKVLGICEKCFKVKAEHIHHLKHQKNADVNGFLEKDHKNHLANLMALCVDCHNNFHKGDNLEYVKRKTLDGEVVLQEI
jgi:DNA mismatch repair protein MutS